MSTTDAATPIDRVGVVGTGRMGSGIAEVCARAGVDVLVWESTRRSTDTGRSRVLESLDRGVSAGVLTRREREQAGRHLRFTTDLGDFADRQLVAEAVREDESVKCEVFARLDEVVTDPHAVLASSATSIPLTHLAARTRTPGRVLGLHFFDPVATLPLVELVATSDTDPAVAERAAGFAEGVLGKQVLRTADRPGFVVNALLLPYILGAVRMVEAGVVGVADADRAVMLGCAHPSGPLALADLMGLDTVLAVARAMYAEGGDPQFAPPRMLVDLVESGRLGCKTGAGFHDYEGPRREPRPPRGARAPVDASGRGAIA